MKTKRILAALLALVMMLSLCACGRKEKVAHRRVCRMYGDACRGRGEEQAEHVRPGNGENGGVENAAAEGTARNLRRGRIRRAFPEEAFAWFQRPGLGRVVVHGAAVFRETC